MNRGCCWVGFVLCLVIALPALADDKKAGEGKKTLDDAAIQAMIKAGTPGPEHKKLDPMAGEWTYTMKMWMDPTQPPSESKGTMSNKWILGGRFLQNQVVGEFMGQPFHGFGLNGYDNLEKKYTSMWTDSASTSISISKGTVDATGKVFTYETEMIDPVSMQKVKGRDIVRIESNDKHSMVAFKTMEGKETKVMELYFTRSK